MFSTIITDELGEGPGPRRVGVAPDSLCEQACPDRTVVEPFAVFGGDFKGNHRDNHRSSASAEAGSTLPSANAVVCPSGERWNVFVHALCVTQHRRSLLSSRTLLLVIRPIAMVLPEFD